MMMRDLLSMAAAILAAAALSACSGGDPVPAGPFGNYDSDPGTQCIPLAGHAVASYGLEFVQNPTKTMATITSVTLRKDHGLKLVHAWAVPTAQLYGVGLGPPPPTFKVIGFRWNRRQAADGARVPQSTGKYDRMNLVLVLRLAPGRTQGRAAGVDVRYEVAGQHYYVPYKTAVVLATGKCPGA
ncbi:MAG TPA: hypothetical protein VHJ18_25230 [Streptosporangiaceae bacterium]|jgi:hypothetical protein|nr:hypothetical protein [Streptosporangiaceae bacterium]